MSESMYINLQSGTRESITLEYDQPLEKEGKFGQQYTYGCVPIITGETRFTANTRVHGLIQELNVGKGDTIIIEKVKATPNDYITVSLPENHPKRMDPTPTGPPIHKSVDKFEKQFEAPDTKLVNHELSVRVEKLENLVKILMKDYGIRTSDAGHKFGDDQIPS